MSSGAENGNMVTRTYYAIRFDDGETWSTEDIIDKADYKLYEDILALVSSRSGRSIQQLDLIDDLKS